MFETKEEREMNEKVLQLIETYQKGGGYGWDPKKGIGKHGVTQDLVYKGQTLLEKDVTTYCCGLSFEIAFLAGLKDYDVPFSEMRKCQRLWYNAADNRKGCQDALISIGAGEIVTLGEAIPGDFLQWWTLRGDGHSVVFCGRNHDISQSSETISFWSTQKATRGIGYGEKKLESLKELYFVRLKSPFIEKLNA